MLGAAFETVVYWHWLALAAIFIGIEMFVPGVFLVFLGIAAAAVGLLIALVPDLDWRLQLLVFAVLAVALIFVGRKVYGRMSQAEDHTGLNRRGEKLVGQVYGLAGDMSGGRGKLRVGDTDWLARTEAGGGDYSAGAKMRVVAVEGATLIVAPEGDATP